MTVTVETPARLRRIGIAEVPRFAADVASRRALGAGLLASQVVF